MLLQFTIWSTFEGPAESIWISTGHIISVEGRMAIVADVQKEYSKVYLSDGSTREVKETAEFVTTLINTIR